MNFAEIRFWVLLAAGLTLILLLRLPLRSWLGETRTSAYDRAAMMMLGLFLLACVSVITVVIFILVAVCTWLGLRWLVRHPRTRHKWYLAFMIPLQLLPLAYYKYAHFVLNQVLPFEFATLRDLLIPVGISFYTFQMVAFVIDTLAFNKAIPGFVNFLNFAGFFPQIVAGPIERRADLLPQMEAFRFRWSREDINAGVSWVVLGLFFKLCLADNVALYFHGRSPANPFLVWLDNVLFGLRIYYDFAGYSLVAVGLGRCLGIRLTLNFLSPYCSTSIVEFWRRWHITLSQWFRDYVYVPMGGGRTRWWWFNVAVVFVVSGIWHGAGWNFVLWGALHGVYLFVNRLLGPKLRLPAPVAWLVTLGSAMFAWLCFYETRPGELMIKLRTLLTPSAYHAAAFREALNSYSGPDLFTMACFLAMASAVLALEWRSLGQGREPYHWLRRPAVLTGLVILTVVLAPGRNNAFIYFAF